MPSSGVASLDEVLGGYPENSTILIIGPPGIGKEALGYWFIQDGLSRGDFCLYVTRLPVRDVINDRRAFGIDDDPHDATFWLASEGGGAKLNLKNPTGMYQELDGLLEKNKGRKVRIVFDVLSSLLVLNPSDSVYALLNQILVLLRRHDVVLLATLEQGMHTPETVTSMEQLFDGFLEMRLYAIGLKIIPLLRVGKMRGVLPIPGYFRFAFTQGKMVLEDAESGWAESEQLRGPEPNSGSLEGGIELARGSESAIVFDSLIKAFAEDYVSKRLPAEQAGWRSRGSIIQSSKTAMMSLYGRHGRYGPVMRELTSKRLVETRFFPGERGRGGEILKLRIAYYRPAVKRLVDRMTGESGDRSW